MYTLLEQMFPYLSRVTSCGYWPLGGKDPSTRLSGPVLDCSLLQQETRTELESFQPSRENQAGCRGKSRFTPVEELRLEKNNLPT